MNKLVEDQRFESRQIRDNSALIEGIEFRRCQFAFCSIAATDDVRKRATLRKIRFVDCLADASRIGGAILDEIVVQELQTKQIFRVSAGVFRHVTLRGRVDEILIHPAVWPGPVTTLQQRAFDDANEVFYTGVDWALDITAADFGAAEIQGIPTRLVRRDAESQVVVRRESALAGGWRGLGLADTPWPGMIQFLIDDGYPEKLLIAPSAIQTTGGSARDS